jgi:hypothetical protein
VDLRGIPAPAPHRLENYNDHRWAAERIGGLLTFRDVKLTGLDLSWGWLESFRCTSPTPTARLPRWPSTAWGASGPSSPTTVRC